MNRLVLAACTAAVLLATTTTAMAADSPSPILTSPTTDAIVGDEVTMTATAETPYVLFRLSRGTTGPFIDGMPVPVVDGTATDTLPAYGLPREAHIYATAAGCAGPAVETCGGISQARLVHRSPLLGLALQPSDWVDPDHDDLEVTAAGSRC